MAHFLNQCLFAEDAAMLPGKLCERRLLVMNLARAQ